MRRLVAVAPRGLTRAWQLQTPAESVAVAILGVVLRLVRDRRLDQLVDVELVQADAAGAAGDEHDRLALERLGDAQLDHRAAAASAQRLVALGDRLGLGGALRDDGVGVLLLL